MCKAESGVEHKRRLDRLDGVVATVILEQRITMPQYRRGNQRHGIEAVIVQNYLDMVTINERMR